MIHVHQLTKHYSDLRRGQFVALGGISFRVRPGQVYGLLGPNGAGKTTALRILSTVLRPTGGSATINGYDVLTQPAAVRRQIGFMSANTAVYDRMTGWEMVEYFGRLHGIPPETLTDRMESLFERLKMNDTRDMLGGEDVDRHEAEGFGGPGGDPRPAGADLRRGHGGARRAGGPGAVARPWPSCAITASASSSPRTSCARPSGFATAWPSSIGDRFWRKGRWRSCATGISSGTWRSCSFN